MVHSHIFLCALCVDVLTWHARFVAHLSRLDEALLLYSTLLKQSSWITILSFEFILKQPFATFLK